jgi:branched-subunit amino acid transport protein
MIKLDLASQIVMVAGMAIVTFLVRYPVLAFVSKLHLPPAINSALKYVPPAVLAAIVVPGALLPEGTLDLSLNNTFLVGAVLAVIIAWRGKNLLLTIVLGMILFWLYRAAVGVL